jgi:thymidylate kinase
VLANTTIPCDSPPAAPLIVEFIGVTGTGKSTLLAAVAAFLTARGVLVRDAESVILGRYGLASLRCARLRNVLLQLVTLAPGLRYLLARAGRPIFRLALALLTRDAGSLRIGTSLLRNVISRFGCHWLLERTRERPCPYEVILCDEGVVHAAHNLFVHTESEPHADEIARFARLVPKPDLLVWVTAPPARSIDVAMRRGHTRVPGTRAAACAFIEHGTATFELLTAAEEIRARLIQIDNASQNVAQTAVALGTMLLRHLERPLQTATADTPFSVNGGAHAHF